MGCYICFLLKCKFKLKVNNFEKCIMMEYYLRLIFVVFIDWKYIMWYVIILIWKFVCEILYCMVV